jgi:hypothetical protein
MDPVVKFLTYPQATYQLTTSRKLVSLWPYPFVRLL